MTDVCDMSKFPPMTYFEQHPMPKGNPIGYPYEHTRGILIRMEPVFDRRNRFRGLSPVLEDAFSSLGPGGRTYPGVKATDRSWEEVAVDLHHVPAVRNPFDFQLWFRSRIVIRLTDDFWQFSRDKDPLTTKYNYGDQYFDLRLHRIEAGHLITRTSAEWKQEKPQGECRCISFFTERPCLDPDLGGPRVTHGYSLNMELFSVGQGGTIDLDEFLPITVDPDIENKGGNPGP